MDGNIVEVLIPQKTNFVRGRVVSAFDESTWDHFGLDFLTSSVNLSRFVVEDNDEGVDLYIPMCTKTPSHVHEVFHVTGGHSIVKLNTTCGPKNLLLVSCITKMGQNCLNFFSRVDIHGIYYIVKKSNQKSRVFFIKHINSK